jgi:bifunctional non-homologous end joining protein LigD
MLPSLVIEPPQGGAWIHEIKFDGYRTMLVIDGSEARAFTRNRFDWSDYYRPVVEAAGKLRCRSAVIDGEVVVLDDSGRSDFHAVKTAIGLGGRGLVFIAFDLLFLNGRDLRGIGLEDRRKELRRLIPASPKSRLQFSEEIADDGAKVFASAEQLGLEGIVSKRLGSKYKSGRVNTWRKTKCWTESTLVLIGTEIDKRSGSPIALLAREEEDGLRYVGGAFFTLKAAQRDALRDRIARLGTDRSPIPALRKQQARWIKPNVVVSVRHLRGSGALRHATVRSLME